MVEMLRYTHMREKKVQERGRKKVREREREHVGSDIRRFLECSNESPSDSKASERAA